MAKKVDSIPKDNNIIRIPIEEAMPDNYLPYAVEVAKDRALPDVRDGLKPVHRRILYGAYMLKAFPDKPYYKSARIVGDILGKYHPHGDASVYDSMVILAQDFSTRKPLIDGQGNWGSVDGDSAAAMRYTEARLTPIALEMLRDIDKDVVEMVPNYSESEMEPKVLPSRYPNLLVNGTFGIAVGLATNIPPHNLREVIQATIAYIENNDISTKELMNYIKGPDLPTAGILIGKNSLLAAYESGEGRVTLRARANIEKLESGRLGIVITEFPYRKNKLKLLQSISDMTADKKHAKALENITDIRDESDRTGIRAVIELKKSADYDSADKVLKYLYKKTDLQSNLSFNMVALANGKPETMGLRTILMHYVNHQKEVITKRSQKELDIAQKRFHIVEGFIKAIDILDQIIETIRASKSKKDAQVNLMEKFAFTDLQAEAILELMLYRLTGLEIKVFEKEYKELEKLIARLQKILGSEKELLRVIKSELEEVMEKYGDDRRTEIVEDDAEAKIDLDELVIIEDTMITLSNEGYIKRIPLKSYNRANSDTSEIEYREGDFNKYLFQSNTKDIILFFTDKGNMYQIKGIDIPEYKWKEKGERLDQIIKVVNLDNERIVSVYSVSNMNADESFMFVTSQGYIKKTSLDKFNTSYSKFMALKLKEGESLIYTALINEEREREFIEIHTKKGLRFTVDEPDLAAVERNVLGTPLVTLGEKDEITFVEFTKQYEYASFSLGININGDIKVIADNRSKSSFKVSTSSLEQILLFGSNGMVYKIPALVLQNIDNIINLSEFVSNFNKDNTKILEVISVKNFDQGYICFFSKKGLVKKTTLKEFEGAYISAQSYKFKTEDDVLIAAKFCIQENSNAIIVTKKAMSIKFMTDTVSTMGKIAAGVTGISLRDDDEVIFGTVIEERDTLKELAVSSDLEGDLKITSAAKQERVISISSIKLQNRAGRGTSIMLIVLDDYIKDVKII